MPFFGMVLFLVIFCGGLLFVMYRILGKQATQATDRFTQMSEDFDQKKSQLKKMEQEAELKADKLVMAAQQESERLKSKAVEETQQLRQEKINESRKDAERIVNDAMKARDAMKLELVEQMHGKTIDAACQLVLNVFPEKLRQDIHIYWVNELLEHGLEALDRFETREEVEAVEIEIAFPLSADHREKIMKAIKHRIHADIILKEKLNPELVAGLRMNLGHLVLEGSLAARLKEAAIHVKNTGV